MNGFTRALRIGAIGLALVEVFAGLASPQARTVASEDTVRSVTRMLDRLPYYGVFDFLAFSVDGGTVTLVGYSYQGSLKVDAEMAASQGAGVDAVVNRIDVLPPSTNDDRIRWATFYRIYTDDFLSRHAPGGIFGVLQELKDARRFPGMQPVGRYPIHIVVKNGRTVLLGIVDHATDRQVAEVRAREVHGVFDVENELVTAR